jgi:hypothetical protein
MPKLTWEYIKQELSVNWWEIGYVAWLYLVLTLMTIYS